MSSGCTDDSSPHGVRELSSRRVGGWELELSHVVNASVVVEDCERGAFEELDFARAEEGDEDYVSAASFSLGAVGGLCSDQV